MDGRVRFDIQVHPPVLVFSPALAADAGEYKCRVDLRKSRTLILQSRLDLTVPPESPIIMDEYGQRLQGVIGPYDENSQLTIICDVDGGQPSPSVTWWRGGSLVDDDFNVTTRGFVRNILTLSKIRRSDLMAKYSCKASNTNLTEPKTEFVKLDINLLPVSVVIEDLVHPMLAGERYELACRTRGSRPPAVTSWWIGNAQAFAGSHESEDDASNSTVNVLRFVPAADDHGRTLTCRAANPALPKTTLQDARVLDVQFIPILNLTLNGSSNASNVAENRDVYLVCSIRSNPWIFSVKWYFEQRELVSNESLGFLVKEQVLKLKSTRREHSGRYHCAAENIVNRATSNALEIRVRYTPKCLFPDQRRFVLSHAETVNASCDVHADPEATDYLWKLHVDEVSHEEILQNWSSTSLVSYSLPEDAAVGALSCWARNRIGTQEVPCQTTLHIASVPETPRNCAVGNVTDSSLGVSCEAGHDGSAPQLFHLDVYAGPSRELLRLNLTSARHPAFKVVGLEAGRSYALLAYASNPKGRSDSVALVATTLAPAARRTALEGAWYVGLILRILVGVVVVFISTLTALGILVAIRKTRQTTWKDSPSEEMQINVENEKKELEGESPDANGKGPDIIPLSAESEVFFVSGKLVESPVTPAVESTSMTFLQRQYKHTVL